MDYSFPSNPRQILPQEAYTSEEWFAKEQKSLFPKTWSFACMAFDLAKPGDFKTLRIGSYPIAIIRDNENNLRAFHNLCRHRGTELLEGCGNSGKTIVCPYHRWTYMLDGRLRGFPNADHLEGIERSKLGLKELKLGIFKEMIFVSPTPTMTFENWIAPLQGSEWPHEISHSKLKSGEEFVYRIKCNWKVFYENAIDGYHLAYLHENTLGGPIPDKNEWELHGLNMVWYSTERDEIRNRVPKFVEDQVASRGGATEVPGAEEPGYGGVYMLFPTTIVTPSKWSLTISNMEPVSPGETILRAKTWTPDSWFSGRERPSDAEGFDQASGEIRSEFWTKPALDSGDFQTEDIWVCEKMQRSLQSPAYEVGKLAQGSGSEATLPVFQQQVLDMMEN